MSAWSELVICLNFFPGTQSIDREIHVWAMSKHQYVLPFYGTVEGFGPFRALVFPWMPNGNLNSYLNRADVTLTMMDRLRIVSFIMKLIAKVHYVLNSLNKSLRGSSIVSNESTLLATDITDGP
jgi:serine/threonine protein kinase